MLSFLPGRIKRDSALPSVIPGPIFFGNGGYMRAYCRNKLAYHLAGRHENDAVRIPLFVKGDAWLFYTAEQIHPACFFKGKGELSDSVFAVNREKRHFVKIY